MDMLGISTVLLSVGVPIYEGYAATGAKLPYIVHRPSLIDVVSSSIGGESLVWDFSHAIYCCAESVEASFNLAKLVLTTIQGVRLGDTVAAASLSYTGARVEGWYETLVTIQLEIGEV